MNFTFMFACGKIEERKICLTVLLAFPYACDGAFLLANLLMCLMISSEAMYNEATLGLKLFACIV
jgi:hypothetical protein